MALMIDKFPSWKRLLFRNVAFCFATMQEAFTGFDLKQSFSA
jgi:hypothetical protein